MSTEKGRELALTLAADADLVFENFRPGTMEAWDLGPADIHEVNERAIMVRLSGYGQTGPDAGKPGFGTIAEGVSGWAHTNGFPDREPLLPPLSLADAVAALFAVQSALMAVYERDVGRGGSGRGQVIDVSLIEPLWRLYFGSVEGYDRTGHVQERTGNHHPSAAPRGVYETADGYITLSASYQTVWERVAKAIDRPDLLDDPRFVDNEARVEHADELDAEIEAWTRERSTERVLEVFESHDAIVGPVNDIADIYEDDQYRARDDFETVDDPDVGEIETFAPIPKFSRTPGDVEFLGPAHGEHNEEVYCEELGLTEEELADLAEAGVV